MHSLRPILLLTLIAACISGCGIRPKSLPPEDKQQKDDPFPRTYPDLATDPRPSGS